jgi:hypothetical protein
MMTYRLPTETTPAAISTAITDLCHRLVLGGVPQFVSVRPTERATKGECIDNVAQFIAHHAGQRVLGWCIWERPGICLNAEFHAVWQSPEGTMRDITPKPDGEDRILFLPDPRIVWQGKRIASVIIPLSYKRDVQELVALWRKEAQMRVHGSAPTAEYVALAVQIQRAVQKLARRLQ